MMKRVLPGLCLLALLAAFPAAAQTAKDEIELTRAVIQTERQAIITAGMQLTDSEATAFWPLYRTYRAEIARVDDRKVNLITWYAENYGDVSDTRAAKMLDDWMAIERDELKVRARYIKQFRKILPERKVTRFFQLENKLDTVIDSELVAEIPLVE